MLFKKFAKLINYKVCNMYSTFLKLHFEFRILKQKASSAKLVYCFFLLLGF